MNDDLYNTQNDDLEEIKRLLDDDSTQLSGRELDLDDILSEFQLDDITQSVEGDLLIAEEPQWVPATEQTETFPQIEEIIDEMIEEEMPVRAYEPTADIVEPTAAIMVEPPAVQRPPRRSARQQDKVQGNRYKIKRGRGIRRGI